MDYAAMVGKLASWFLVSEGKRIGFLVGALASLIMLVPVFQAGLHGLTIYCLSVFFLQMKGYFNRRPRKKIGQDQAEFVEQMPCTD